MQSSALTPDFSPDMSNERNYRRCGSRGSGGRRAPRQPRRPARWLLRAVTALAVVAGLHAMPSVGAQQANLPSEYAVKAVYLYSFGRYVEWPKEAFADRSSPFVIGVLGDDPFGGALDEIASKKKIQDRPITVRSFAAVDQLEGPCHIIFVSRLLTADEQSALLKKTEGKGVLVVGETAGFAKRGAAINFFIDEDRVRFEINADAARRAGLKINAKLLSLGKRVKP
jgi:hypothetical protein